MGTRVLLLLILPLLSSGSLLYLHKFDAKQYPQAQCTDGTVAGYYWLPAPEEASETSKATWIMYLKGGAWCYSKESCAERCGTPDAPFTNSSLCSSAEWEDSMSLEGLMQPQDESLQDVNKVFVHYCTSDAHMGDATAYGWQFRGQKVVEATLSEMVNTHGFGRRSELSSSSSVECAAYEKNNTQRELLIFGGGSAGGRGAMVHLDYVTSMLTDVGVACVDSRVDVLGFLDSNLWLDIEPLTDNFTGFARITQAVVSHANITHMGAKCSLKYQGDEKWKCAFGEYRMPFVQTPYFLIASQYDAYQLWYNILSYPKEPEQIAYAEAFAKRTARVMKSLRGQWAQDQHYQNAMYSRACYEHSTSLGDEGFNKNTATSKKVTMNDAYAKVSSQWNSQSRIGDGDDEFSWFDECDGFACGAGCSNGGYRSH